MHDCSGLIHLILFNLHLQLSLCLFQTVFRIVVLGIWDYIENKVEVSFLQPHETPIISAFAAESFRKRHDSAWQLLQLLTNDSYVGFSQVFDGAIIVLSLAPMVASTVANGPSSPWDAIGLIITLRIWRVKRIIDGETRGC